MNILIVRISSLGDVVMTTPVFEMIKTQIKESRIVYLVDEKYAPLLSNNPYVDSLLTIKWSEYEKKPFKLIKEIFKIIRFIRFENIDMAFDFQGLFRSVIFLWFSKAKKKFARGNWLFLTKTLPHKKKSHIHNVIQNFEIISLAGIRCEKKYSQNISSAVKSINIKNICKTHLQSFDKIIAVNPWTRWKTKNIPAILLGESCNLLGNKIRCHFFILGAANEIEQGTEVYNKIKHPKTLLTGCLNLNELMGLLVNTDLLITGDTGTMHIASALKTPTVAIFGPTHPLRTGPYEGNFKVVASDLSCMPCFKRVCPLEHRNCINSLRAEDIVSPSLILLDKKL